VNAAVLVGREVENPLGSWILDIELLVVGVQEGLHERTLAATIASCEKEVRWVFHCFM
jgi:hypothetical protein